MAYATTAEIKEVTGWTGGAAAPYKDISDADIASLIDLADAHIDAMGLDDRGAIELQLLSCLYTAYLGSLRLEADIQSYGGNQASVSVSFRSPNSWLEAFNEVVASGGLTNKMRKVYY